MKNYLTKQEINKLNKSLLKHGYSKKSLYRTRNKKGQFISSSNMVSAFLFTAIVTIAFMVLPPVWNGLAYTIEYVADPIIPIVHGYKVEVPSEKTYLVNKAVWYANRYGVDPKLMIDLITCEAGPDWQTDIQSYHKYKYDSAKWGVKKGDRELSFGLVQIHLPDHPTVTYEQAIDPDFALDFMAKHIADGRVKMWSCYKIIR